LLSFGAEYFIFQCVIQKYEDLDIKTTISPVDLYRCGTWTLTLREEYRLSVFENRVLKRIFWPNRDKVTG
jgi:hypothetical protein